MLASAEAPSIVVGFPVQGKLLPADHGYALYAALARQLPALHRAPWLGVELVSGLPARRGTIALPSRGASLRLRMPADRFPVVLPLAGKRLEIGGHPLRLGIPGARPLMPAPSLYARAVTIKNFTEAEPFLDAARRQLAALGVAARLELPLDEHGRFRRRVLRIHRATVVGFSVAVHDLNEGDSLRLQSVGIGGRRAMGCGLFNPVVRFRPAQERVP